MNYGNRLKELIKSKNLTQTEVAERLNINSQNISLWVSKAYPGLEAIEKVCAAIGISVSEFFCSEECPHRNNSDIPEELLMLSRSVLKLDPDTQLKLIDAWDKQLDIILDQKK